MDDSNSSGAAAPHWQLSPVTLTPDDPLLGCLLVVARMHERAASPDTLTAGLPLMRRLQPALRKGDWKVTVALHKGNHDARPRILDIFPGFYEGGLYGLAIDLGSTTIAAHLCDLRDGSVLASSGLMNPQIRFGEDLMSRVSYVMMNPGGDRNLTVAVREALQELIDQAGFSCAAGQACGRDRCDGMRAGGAATRGVSGA